jgi:hypothetical protein
MMFDLKKAQLEMIQSLMAFDRASEEHPRNEKVLPKDLDLDEELAALFRLIED